MAANIRYITRITPMDMRIIYEITHNNVGGNLSLAFEKELFSETENVVFREFVSAQMTESTKNA
jgi:hypothetical protein